MRRRCNTPTHINFANYGGRGIKVCERWSKFENFLADMGERPEGATLDRIDQNGNYEPTNCRWADAKTQSANRRTAVYLEYNGRSLSLTEWAKLTGIDYRTLSKRVFKQNWPVEKALTTPCTPTRTRRALPLEVPL